MNGNEKLDYEFYPWFKLLVVVLIILNVVDTITTFLGVYHVPVLAEANPFLALFLSNMVTFLILKAVILTGLLLAALGYLLRVHHVFRKLWENEVAITLCALVVIFYLYVVANNIVLLFLYA